MKRPLLLSVFALLLSVSLTLHGQAIPTATRTLRLQAGAGFSFAVPDYGETYIKGYTIYGDVDLMRRLSAEIDVHDISILTPMDIGQNTYLIGPRFSVLRQDRLHGYVKALGGIGRFEYQKGTYFPARTDTYGVFAVGGGIEFRASPHINVRAIDIEAQRWPGFGPHGLTPFVTTFGVAYVH